MLNDAVERRTFSMRLDCHYLLDAPASVSPRTLVVATLHGYSSNPDVMLRLTRAILGTDHVIAAIQGPSQFFLSTDKQSSIGYCWATQAHPTESVRLHHDMVSHVFDEVSARFGLSKDRRLLIGFSQPVGMNYRYAATHPEEVRGVIGICGGVPKNWETGDYKPVQAALLHIARREDDIYPPETTNQYADRLRGRANDVEFHMLDGGHRFPSKAAPIVEQWAKRVFPAK